MSEVTTLPKVSGILLVGYGDKYFRVAADAFLSSTYEGELELVILDNNETPLDPSLIPDDPRVQYYRCERKPIGALRNLGTSYATGDICINLDEDDWSHSERVSQQVGRLLGTGKAVTGFHSIYYFNESDRSTFKYWYEPRTRNHPPYACGSSQMYLKSWWETHKYPETGVEDYPFQLAALHANQLDSVDGAELLVARAHHGSVSFPTAPYPGYLIYSLISSRTNEFLSLNRLSSGPYTGAAPYPVENATGDNVTQLTGFNTAWDWVCIKLAIATTGTVMMGRLTGGNGDGPIQPLRIDPTDGGVLSHVMNDLTGPLYVQVTAPVSIGSVTALPVQLEDGSGNTLTSTSGSLNVHLTNPISPLPVLQSGTWTLTATNPSVGPTQVALPGQATVMGIVSAANGFLEVPVMDANSGLRVNIAAGSASTNPAASATSAGVPADASYTGLDIGGNLVGQTGFSLTNVKAAAIAIVDSNGNQIGDASGSLSVKVVSGGNPAASGAGSAVPADASYSGFNSGGTLVGVSSTNPLPVALSAGTTALTSTTGGALNVSVVNASGTSNPAASATSSAVPADASYTGFNRGGNLVGVSATTPLPVSMSGAMDVAAYVTASAPAPTANTYSPLSLNSSGGLRVDASGTNLTTNILAGNAVLTNTSGSLNVLVTGASSALSCNSTLCIGEPYNPVSDTLSVPVSANTTPQSATNPMFTQLTDGSKAIQTAVSALGTAPIGNAVMAVNSVHLSSAAAGAALSAKFINASGAAVSIKNSSGNLYGFSLTNSTASPAFVEFFNSASTPTLGTTAVAFCVVIPASGNVTINPTTLGLMNFSTGIGFAVTTTENGSTTAGVTGMIFYA